MDRTTQSMSICPARSLNKDLLSITQFFVSKRSRRSLRNMHPRSISHLISTIQLCNASYMMDTYLQYSTTYLHISRYHRYPQNIDITRPYILVLTTCSTGNTRSSTPEWAHSRSGLGNQPFDCPYTSFPSRTFYRLCLVVLWDVDQAWDVSSRARHQIFHPCVSSSSASTRIHLRHTKFVMTNSSCHD